MPSLRASSVTGSTGSGRNPYCMKCLNGQAAKVSSRVTLTRRGPLYSLRASSSPSGSESVRRLSARERA